MYGRGRPRDPHFQCDECGHWMKRTKAGKLYRHNRKNPDYNAQGLPHQKRYYIECTGKPMGHLCPACDGTGVVGQEL